MRQARQVGTMIRFTRSRLWAALLPLAIVSCSSDSVATVTYQAQITRPISHVALRVGQQIQVKLANTPDFSPWTEPMSSNQAVLVRVAVGAAAGCGSLCVNLN